MAFALTFFAIPALGIRFEKLERQACGEASPGPRNMTASPDVDEVEHLLH